MKYDQWNILPGNQEAAAALEAHGIPPLAALVLCARGLDTPDKATEFLRADTALLPDPFLLRDMDKAVARLERALQERELVCIYGDYDVDGITATCLLTSYLTSRGGRVIPYVPNRLTEGYSLNDPAIDQLHQQGVGLIVTVDCGITNVAETEHAAQLGIDIIITDHHECKEVLPNAAAVINPHRPDCGYPFQSLAGVGVALKLVLAMTAPERRPEVLSAYCDLAAIGTVADVMDLRGENRAIVALGLRQMESDCRPGLAALIREAGQENRALSASSISFSLAPRINAAGRMGCPELAVGLLLTTDPAQAEVRARQLCTLNRNRQAVELSIFEGCQEYLQRHPKQAEGAIVLASPEWHQGVVGIVASRLSERYQVPTFMICLEQGKGKGSCRSWGQFNLFQALEQCSDLLESFGGHELAAGFTILEENIPAFRARMSQLALDWYATHPTSTALTIDVMLKDTRLLSKEHVRSLDLLEPNGTGNPTPVFAMERFTVAGFSRVGGGRHTRLQLRKNGSVFDGIYFSATPKDAQLVLGAKVDVAFNLQVNEFRGVRSLQLQVVSCRPSGNAALQSQQLYSRYRSGAALTGQELSRLIPDRQDFVAVWRYLTRIADRGQLRETPVKLSQKISRSTGQQQELSRVMVCLEVFHERGLIELRTSSDSLQISILKTDKKVDLEASEILIRLRRRKSD